MHDMHDFIKITETEGEAFQAAMDIYSASFPLNEQQPISTIKARVVQGSSELYIGRYGDETVFMALLFPLPGTDFILLDYMATLASHRGKNAGSLFLQYMVAQLTASGNYFLIESEDPASGNNRQERERRITFYQRNGAKLLSGVHYILPGMHGLEPTDMFLLVMPAYPGDVMDGNLVRSLISQVYEKLYNRHPGDPLLENCLRSIPPTVGLM